MTAISPHLQPTFHSIQEFQNHFEKTRTLTLPANQRLLIQNIPSQLFQPVAPKDATSKDTSTTRQTLTASKVGVKIDEVLSILSKMLYPIGKTLQLESSDNNQGRKVLFECGSDCSLQSFDPIILKAVRGTIFTKLSDLFSLMIHSSRLEMKLAKNQKIQLLDVPNYGNLEKAPVHYFHKIASEDLPDGHLYRLAFNQNKQAVVNSTINRNQNTFEVSSSKGITVSLLRASDYLNFSSFAKLFIEKQTIVLSQGIALKIHDPVISRLHEEYTQTYQPYFTPISFLLGHLFHTLGKVIVEKGAPIEVTINGTCLELRSTKESTLELKDGEVSMAVCHLENCLLSDHSSLFSNEVKKLPAFHFTRPFTIYGLSEIEDLEFAHIDQANNIESTSECFQRFFMRHAPVGFFWSRLFTNFAWETSVYETNGQSCFSLQVSPNPNSVQSGEMKFWLTPAVAEQSWVRSVFNHSPPDLLTEFVDGNYAAIQLIMIKVILHYCITGRHYLKNPTFFSASVTEQILDLVLLTPDPKRSHELLQEILLDLEDPLLSENDFRKNQTLMEVPKLLQMAPEEFLVQQLKNISPEANQLMSKLLAITSNADRSLFNKGLADLFKEIKNKTYLPYLKNAHFLTQQ